MDDEIWNTQSFLRVLPSFFEATGSIKPSKRIGHIEFRLEGSTEWIPIRWDQLVGVDGLRIEPVEKHAEFAAPQDGSEETEEQVFEVVARVILSDASPEHTATLTRLGEQCEAAEAGRPELYARLGRTKDHDFGEPIPFDWDRRDFIRTSKK
jgi:hypothetical protein